MNTCSINQSITIPASIHPGALHSRQRHDKTRPRNHLHAHLVAVIPRAVQTQFDPRVCAHDAFEKLAVITRAVAVYVQLRKQISGGLLSVRDKKALQCLAKLLESNRVAAGCNTCQITHRAHEHLSNTQQAHESEGSQSSCWYRNKIISVPSALVRNSLYAIATPPTLRLILRFTNSSSAEAFVIVACLSANFANFLYRAFPICKIGGWNWVFQESKINHAICLSMYVFCHNPCINLIWR